MEGSLKVKAHPARSKKFDGSGKALIIATACSLVPAGKGHWTVRMLAAWSKVWHPRPSIRAVFKKAKLNPGSIKMMYSKVSRIKKHKFYKNRGILNVSL
jgi:hypothetical protein